MTGYLASVSKDEGHQGGTWTKRAQAGHRESRSGKTQQVWKVKDGTVVEDAATRLPLASAPPGLSVTGDTVAGSGGGGTAFGSPTCLDVRPGPGCLPRTVPRAGASTPAGPRYDGDVGPVRPDPPSKVGVTMAAERAGSLASALSPVPSAAGGSAQAAAGRAARLALRC